MQSLYFGGGTPSLVDPDFIISTIQLFANVGFQFNADTEITIEINPATLTEEKLNQYLSAGVNRFSVGAQTFNDHLLTLCGRKHSAQDTRETLTLLKDRELNYSFDLLFALPRQTLSNLQRDLDEISEWAPPHLSTYCLTVPEGHPMSFNRPEDEVQVEMFDLIERSLKHIHLNKYELSNFSKTGFESKHNLTYWTDRPFWGVGLSSHSYDPTMGTYGTRFWNTKSIKAYPKDVLKGKNFEEWSASDQHERLKLHESMTDTCHMFLRMSEGLPLAALQKFPSYCQELIKERFVPLIEDRLITSFGGRFALTPEGQLKSNLVYRHLTFLSDEVQNDAAH